MAIMIHPPMNQSVRNKDVQPSTVASIAKRYIAQIPKNTPIRQNIIPIKKQNRMGFTENDVMPSIAKFNILLNGYLLSPAKRSALL